MYISHPVPEGLRILDTDTPPAPSPEALGKARAIWEREKAVRPDLFNGRIFSLTRLEGDTAHGYMADFLWYVAQLQAPDMFKELKVSSLAVSGLVIAREHVIFGLRKPGLAVEGGLWELAPCGTLHGGLREPDGSISWRLAFLEELREELGIEPPSISPRAFALVENTRTHIWELGVAAELDLDHRDILGAFVFHPSPEHSEMAAVPLSDVPKFYGQRKENMVGACGLLLSAYGLIPPL